MGEAKARRRAEAELQRHLKRGYANNALSVSCMHAISLWNLMQEEIARVDATAAENNDPDFFFREHQRAITEQTVTPPGRATALMTAFYVALNTVVEGWQDPAQPAPPLADSRVDCLLNSPNVGLLREYRHSRAHPNPLDDKRFLAFAESHGEIVRWAVQLLEAFGTFFVAWRATVNAARTPSAAAASPPTPGVSPK